MHLECIVHDLLLPQIGNEPQQAQAQKYRKVFAQQPTAPIHIHKTASTYQHNCSNRRRRVDQEPLRGSTVGHWRLKLVVIAKSFSVLAAAIANVTSSTSKITDPSVSAESAVSKPKGTEKGRNGWVAA
jgi:hypothetical protein